MPTAADRAAFPGSWNTYGQSRDGGPVGESGRWQQHTLLGDSDAFDWLFHLLLQHPLVIPLVVPLRHLIATFPFAFLTVDDNVNMLKTDR